jgi:hypothetical protein
VFLSVVIAAMGWDCAVALLSRSKRREAGAERLFACCGILTDSL